MWLLPLCCSHLSHSLGQTLFSFLFLYFTFNSSISSLCPSLSVTSFTTVPLQDIHISNLFSGHFHHQIWHIIHQSLRQQYFQHGRFITGGVSGTSSHLHPHLLIHTHMHTHFACRHVFFLEYNNLLWKPFFSADQGCILGPNKSSSQWGVRKIGWQPLIHTDSICTVKVRGRRGQYARTKEVQWCTICLQGGGFECPWASVLWQWLKNDNCGKEKK